MIEETQPDPRFGLKQPFDSIGSTKGTLLTPHTWVFGQRRKYQTRLIFLFAYRKHHQSESESEYLINPFAEILLVTVVP